MTDIDLLAIVTRPDFPSGQGPIGDHMGLRSYAAARPSLSVRTIALNEGATRIHLEDGRIIVAQRGEEPIEIVRAKLVLYMPVCLEVEETNLAAAEPGEPYPLFAAQQWRPLTEYLEDALPRLARCINEPRALRRANNKLIQLDLLRREGLPLPPTALATGFPEEGGLAGSARLVRKNVSEGGWKSETEFSPARLAGPGESDTAPAIWQRPIEADHELRVYVMGEEAIFVRLEREAAITDVRATGGGRPRASIVDGKSGWKELMLAAAKALGLDYAVIDAMPDGEGGLVVLEVNANGVWWFLPDAVGRLLEGRFHAFLDRMIAAPRTRL
jgi:hypothetical protein